MPSRGPLAALLLLVATLPAVASAQEAGDPAVTLWTEARTTEGELKVENGTKLVIRDAVVSLGGPLVVEAHGVLVLETTGQPTGLAAGPHGGYSLRVHGAMFLNGTLESPVTVDGSGGLGVASGDTILFRDGIESTGLLDATHARFVNYTAGLRSGANATVNLRDTLFQSPKGLGLVASLGYITGERVTFEGPGAGYWSVANGQGTLRDSTFREGGTAIMSNGNTTVLERVRVERSEGCIRNTVGILRVTGFDCVDYNGTGIHVSKPVKGSRLPSATLQDVRVSTTRPNASIAIHVSNAPGTVLDGIDVGPVPQQGVVVDGDMATISNATFHGVGDFNVAVFDVVRNAPTAQIGDGTPGPSGWLFVGHRFSARVLGVDGQPAPGAVVEVRHANGTLALRKTTTGQGVTTTSALPNLVVGPDGVVHAGNYTLRAFHPQNGGLWTREGYVPDGDVLLIHLLETQGAAATPKDTPGPSALALLGVVAALGYGLRYRRSRI